MIGYECCSMKDNALIFDKTVLFCVWEEKESNLRIVLCLCLVKISKKKSEETNIN